MKRLTIKQARNLALKVSRDAEKRLVKERKARK